MTSHRLTNWALAVLIIVLYALLIASIEDHSDARSEWEQSTALADAIKTEAAQARFARASAILCGSENAVAKDLGNGVIQCQTRRGANTRKAVL